MLKLRFLVAALAVVVIAGCDEALAPDAEAVGVVFLASNGSEAARFQAESGASGQLTGSVGSTTRYDVRALLSNGERVGINGGTLEIRQLRAVITSAANVSLDGTDRIQVSGTSALNTSIQFQLFQQGQEAVFVTGVPLRIQ